MNRERRGRKDWVLLALALLAHGCALSLPPEVIVTTDGNHWHRLPVPRAGAELFVDACTTGGTSDAVVLVNYDEALESGTHSRIVGWSVDCSRNAGLARDMFYCFGEMGSGMCEVAIDDSPPNPGNYAEAPEVTAICEYFASRASRPPVCGN